MSTCGAGEGAEIMTLSRSMLPGFVLVR